APIADLLKPARIKAVDDECGISPGCESSSPDERVLRDAIASMQDQDCGIGRRSIGQNDRAHLMLTQYSDRFVADDQRCVWFGTFGVQRADNRWHRGDQHYAAQGKPVDHLVASDPTAG